MNPTCQFYTSHYEHNVVPISHNNKKYVASIKKYRDEDPQVVHRLIAGTTGRTQKSNASAHNHELD